MRVGIIGRTETLFETALRIKASGHEICFIVTAKEAPEYSKTVEDYRELAKEWNVPFIVTTKISEIADQISEHKPDIGVSMNFSSIIPQNIIDLFPFGILNAHGGDLPRYRGNACKAWAIINGESKVGLCIHRMIGGEVDSGDIVAREYHPVDINTKVTELYKWMDNRIPVLFQQSVTALQENPNFVVEKQSKDIKDALRCYSRRPEDGKIDWQRSNIDVLRLINASNHPYAGAFGFFNDSKVIFWDASLAPEENFLAIPGQITLINAKQGYVEIACGTGKIRVSQIEHNHVLMTPEKLFKSTRERMSLREPIHKS